MAWPVGNNKIGVGEPILIEHPSIPVTITSVGTFFDSRGEDMLRSPMSGKDHLVLLGSAFL
jgi:hypothetical protein